MCLGLLGAGTRSFPVHTDLCEDEDVHHHLHSSAHPELEWGVSEQEVTGLEDVSTQPHYHHLYTGARGKGVQQ